MSKHKKQAALVAAGLTALVALTACSHDQKADVVSHNLSQDADNFQVSRQIVLYNTFTDKYIAEVNGRCSLGNEDTMRQRTVTCQVGPDKYIKDIFNLGDNTVVFTLQTQPSESDPYHYEINLRPSVIIPNLNVR